MLKELIRKNRSYRRFDESHAIELATLRDLVDLARLAPSGANMQPLKYMLSNEPQKNALIFETLAWAGYLKDWPGPVAGERPAAYIIVLQDERIKQEVVIDHGFAVQNILLGAVEQGLGGCVIASVQREVLRKSLQIPDSLRILLVIALGRPVETVVIDDAEPGQSIQYWREADGVHHVPKRRLDHIIMG
ncbi:MAG: nitroreductase family protein [Candidatus Zhuqueibacterota bacterium]